MFFRPGRQKPKVFQCFSIKQPNSIQKSWVFKNISFYIEFYHFFQKHPFLQWILLSKNISFYSVFEKMGQSWTYVSSKTSVFTMNSAYFWVHVSKTPVFTMNSACFLPKNKPKHIFVQKHQFLQWIMHTFSKTSVFTMNYAHFYID